MPIIRANLEVINEQNVWEDIRYFPTEYRTVYSGAQDFNVSTARVYHVTLQGSPILNLVGYTDPIISEHVYNVILILKQGTGGNKLIVFPSNVKFMNNITPVWSNTENHYDIAIFTTRNNGLTWTGQLMAKGLRR